MEEKLRPGVFSSYTAGSSGYGSGSRAAGPLRAPRCG